jgi:AraC-like DNA-binding protein
MPGAGHIFGVLVYPLTAICGTHPVWFWLFCVTLFGDHPRLTRVDWIALAFMAVTGVLDQAVFGTGWAASHAAWSRALGLVYGAAALGFACLAPLAVYAGSGNDLDERRRQVRAWFVPLAAAYLVIIVATQVCVMLVGRPAPVMLVLANLALIDALAAVALWSFLRVRVVNWLDLVAPAPDTQALSRLERSVLERLTARFVPERLYARDGLTIAVLARLLDTQEHVLRRVINGALGFRNFNAFLHSCRLREAAARLRNLAERRIPILTIALEAGYGSIGPFNRAFKERFGATPTEYRRAHPGEHSPAESVRTDSPLTGHTSPSRPA